MSLDVWVHVWWCWVIKVASLHWGIWQARRKIHISVCVCAWVNIGMFFLLIDLFHSSRKITGLTNNIKNGSFLSLVRWDSVTVSLQAQSQEHLNGIQPSLIFIFTPFPLWHVKSSSIKKTFWICMSVFVSSGRWWTIPMKKQGYNGTEYLGTRGPGRQPWGLFVHSIYLHNDTTHAVPTSTVNAAL